MTAYPFTPSDAEERIKESIKPVEFKFSDFGTGFMDENLPAIAIDYLMNHQDFPADENYNPKQDPPVTWSETKNVVWKAEIVGRGHGSPTIVGKHVYIASADEKADVQYVICLDRATGKNLWQTAVHKSGMMQKNKKASAASTRAESRAVVASVVPSPRALQACISQVWP